MNKHCFRVVFNKARGLFMAVSEIVVSRTKGSRARRVNGKSNNPVLGVKSLSFCIWAALGWIGVSPAAQAQILADKNAPANQQATVLQTANGLPQVNIQTPSNAGVSRNTYRQFDVDRKGVILNNARTTTQTQTGGWVQGNPWLAKGTARVILNEVNSADPSQLKGYVEVAGDRAQVVVASPSGITCDGCGFINSNRVTLTTGSVTVNNGQIEGYRVKKGEIDITGRGMDASRADYTDLIARSVKVNAGIWANRLKVTSGSNEVDADHNRVETIASAGSRPSYAIDVSHLGGMYAGKITLVGTENGVGVRSAGLIAASAGDIVVTADGRIENAGEVAGASNLVLKAAEGIENSGVLGAQSNLKLTAKGEIQNQGTMGVNQGKVALKTQGRIHNAGKVMSPTELTVTTADAIENSGVLEAQRGIVLSAQNAITNQGTVAVNQGQIAVLTDGTVDNVGVISGQGDIDIEAMNGSLKNNNGKIEALMSVRVTAQGVDNAQGRMLASELDINSRSQTLDNLQGEIVATHEQGAGTLTIQSGELNNRLGILQAQDSLNISSDTLNNETGLIQGFDSLDINTNHHALINTYSASGGGLVGRSGVKLKTGDLDNTSGYIGSGSALNIEALQVDNTKAGTIESQDELTFGATQLDNSKGAIRSQGDVSIQVNKKLDNVGGLISAAGPVLLKADQVDNSQGQVISDVKLTINAINGVGNAQGELLASKDLTLTSAKRIDNSHGLISSALSIDLQDANLANQTLNVINSGGSMIADQKIAVNSRRLTGDGELLSQGDITVKVVEDYIHAGLVKTNGLIDFETAGTLTNQSRIQSAEEINLKAATIDNQADGEVIASTVVLQATDSHTLINRGLINGQDTLIDTVTLDNLGSGRIYADHLAIQANTVNNLAEGKIAPVIAARERLDIGAQTVNNQDHALIYSAGGMAVGGSLDADRYATGRAQTLNNRSATIESLGNMDLAANRIYNVNESLVTDTVELEPQRIVEWKFNGGPYAATRYSPDEVYICYHCSEKVNFLVNKATGYRSDRYIKYIYNRSVSETVVTDSDPAKILSGGHLNFDSNLVENDNSHVISGGSITGSTVTVNNIEQTGTRTTTDLGSATYYRRKRGESAWGEKDRTKSSTGAYQPAPKVETITLNTVVYQPHANSNGSGTGPDGLGVVWPIDPVEEHTPFLNSSLYRVNPNIKTNSRTNYYFETDPLFIDGLAFNQNILGSDYLLAKLDFGPNITKTRLGDAYYEQRFLREQVQKLTGNRFLSGYHTEEEQYRALMNNAIDYAKRFSIAPGVALTADQMAQLTTDIVWLVEKELTQSDGSARKVLVPQLYLSHQQVALMDNGTLISAQNIDLNVAGDVNNSGTIQSSGQTNLVANNLNNLNGRIRGRDIDLQAHTDLNNLGGRITAENSLSARAGRDLNMASTTRTQTSAQGSRNNIASVAQVSVTGGNGDLNLSSGRNLSIKGTQITSQSAGDTNITAGQNLNIETVAETHGQKVVWDSSNWIADSTKTETGSQIQTLGNVNLNAGQDLNAKAAQITSTQGDLNVNAGRNIALSSAENTVDSRGRSKQKNGGLMGGTDKSSYGFSSTQAQKTSLSGNNVNLLANEIKLSGVEARASDALNLTAKSLEVAAVNETTSSQSVSSSSDMLSAKSKKNINVVTSNVASSLNAKGITLNATERDVTLIGSNIDASGTLSVNSANDIKVQSGYEGGLLETEKKESSFLSGGNLFTQSEDLEGKLVKADVHSNLQAKDVQLTAGQQMTLEGVNIQAKDSLVANAKNTTVTHAEKEEKNYSKHSKVSVGLGDVAQSLLKPNEILKMEDGKMSVTLAKAEYQSADHVKTKTTAQSSHLQAKNISLNAVSEQNTDDTQGNISLTATDLTAKENLDLNATNKVSIKEAKNTVVTEEKDTQGKAELRAVVKNEYVMIKVAAEALQKALSQLENAKSDYDQYQKELKTQKSNLAQLKQDLKNGKLSIEQVDVDEMQDLISDLEADDGYYKANIALAATNLASKTTALAAQTAKAAASSGTYGFNAGVELDIDATENQLTAYEESSLASNLNANNITINSGDKTSLQGTELNAKQDIQINSKELDILASTDVQNSTQTTDHKNLNLSYDFYGGANASASADGSKTTTSGVTNTNSTLSANNITLNAAETTRIEGANINAQDQLSLNTQNLDVASVQDSQTSKQRSQGMSAGVGRNGLNAVGYNSDKSDSKQKQTRLTTLTGKQVNINVDEHTAIQGATIAAVDENGNDNGQLTLTTHTLQAGSLNNSLSRQSQSLGVNASLTNAQDKTAETNPNISSVGLDYSHDRTNSKTKTLATLGEGSIQIQDLENSDTKVLNRDIQDNQIDIYNISSHKGLSGSLDTRMLTEEGRAKIQKDFKEFGQNFQKASQGLPEADHDNAVIAAIGKTLDTASDFTGGVIPSNGTNGGLLGNLPIYFGDPDNQHRVIGDETSSKVYIPGILNDEESAMQGGKNIIGEDQSFQVWTNPSHGAISDVLEAAVDLLNPIGLQTGISKQVEQRQEENEGLEINLHSQAHYIAAEGARNTQNRHTYMSYGSPMPKVGDNILFKSVAETFKDYAGKPPEEIQKNDGDYIAKPLNIFDPKTWSMPGHATENYGAAKLKKNKQPLSERLSKK